MLEISELHGMDGELSTRCHQLHGLLENGPEKSVIFRAEILLVGVFQPWS